MNIGCCRSSSPHESRNGNNSFTFGFWSKILRNIAIPWLAMSDSRNFHVSLMSTFWFSVSRFRVRRVGRERVCRIFEWQKQSIGTTQWKNGFNDNCSSCQYILFRCVAVSCGYGTCFAISACDGPCHLKKVTQKLTRSTLALKASVTPPPYPRVTAPRCIRERSEFMTRDLAGQFLHPLITNSGWSLIMSNVILIALNGAYKII